jgi:DMSO/TMAO reductase YedYZ molybdopterin-dependent catalytic subunit
VPLRPAFSARPWRRGLRAAPLRIQGRDDLQQLLRVRHRQGRSGHNAHTLITRPWTVAVEGESRSPRSTTIDELIKLAPLEERIYRLRCVEGWSMVIPWVGWSLAS